MNKEDLKIVFLGTPEFAVESLDRMVSEGYNIVGVVTMPDKAAGRGKHLQQSAVKQYAVAHGLKVLQPVNLKDPEFVDELRALQADLFVVIAFRMLPEIVWNMPPLGTFNLHASLLPRYRGAAPINRAVMNGDTETGVTTFFLKHEIDTGDIIAQERIAIGPDEDAGSVHDRLMALGATLTVDTIAHIIKGDLTPIPQDRLIKDEAPLPAPKIFKDTCRIDWTRPAAEIHNHIRGLAPYPGAWSELKDNLGNSQGVFKIFATRPLDTPSSAAPGTLTIDGKRLIAHTGDRQIQLLSVQTQGKKRMAADDFLRGCRLEAMTLE